MAHESYSSPDRDYHDVEDDALDGNFEVPVSRDSGVAGLHFDNLFDADEDASGEYLDAENQNRPIDNSTATDETAILAIGHIDPDTDHEHDTQEHVIPQMDAADLWIAQKELELRDDVSLDTDDFPPEQTPEPIGNKS